MINELYNAPCFIINMDKCPDRMKLTTERVTNAGFKDIRRWRAVDAAEKGALAAGWQRHGSPKFWEGDVEFTTTFPGKQGCMLSWLDLLKHIIDNKIPLVTIFEDDVLFHKNWAILAPKYYEATPKDFDYLYLGGQFDAPCFYAIDRVPTFCTHALVFTLAGATKIYNLLLNHPQGVSTIDCMLINMQRNPFKCPFVYYVWNGTMHQDPNVFMAKDWTKRNAGLVFQDYDLGTFVREW